MAAPIRFRRRRLARTSQDQFVGDGVRYQVEELIVTIAVVTGFGVRQSFDTCNERRRSEDLIMRFR